MNINDTNINAIRSFDPTHGVYLKVEGKGKDKHLVAEKKGWLGRFAIKMGWSNPYSKKVMEYYEQNPITLQSVDKNLFENLGKINQQFAHARKISVLTYLSQHPIQLQLENPKAPTENDKEQLIRLRSVGEKIVKENNFKVTPALQAVALTILKITTPHHDQEDLKQYITVFIDNVKLNQIADQKEAEQEAKIKKNQEEVIKSVNAKLGNKRGIG